MGLAPYGEPKYKDLILNNLIDLKEDGTFRLNMDYFNYATGLTMTNKKFTDLFGHPVRKSEEDKLTKFHMDVASSIQSIVEEVIIRLGKSLLNEYKIKNICLAGGVALNCVANGKLLKTNFFKNLWIQPAAGDAGGALGSALALWHKELNKERKISKTDDMRGSYLGPKFTQVEVEKELKKLGAVFENFSQEEMIEITAKSLSEEKAIGWFQGRMEFGPRALGARSIIADPRSKTMQKKLNLKVKYRESFRPFAPSVLKQHVSKWFDIDGDSPYMLLVANIKEDIKREMTEQEKKLFGIDKLNIVRSSIPSVTHVDYSARIQTVHEETNPIYYDLIKKFYELTNCPIVINTSFNVRGEPIVCTIEDAFKCFMGTELDMLICGNSILFKEKQNLKLKENYKNSYSLD
jgi:carbamoyltransferase